MAKSKELLDQALAEIKDEDSREALAEIKEKLREINKTKKLLKKMETLLEKRLVEFDEE